MIGNDRDRVSVAMVSRVERDAIEGVRYLERRQCRNETYAEARAHQFERHLIGAAMRDDAMRRQHLLIPFLDAQRMLVPEMELDTTVEHRSDRRRRGVEVTDRGEIDGFGTANT